MRNLDSLILQLGFQSQYAFQPVRPRFSPNPMRLKYAERTPIQGGLNMATQGSKSKNRGVFLDTGHTIQRERER